MDVISFFSLEKSMDGFDLFLERSMDGFDLF